MNIFFWGDLQVEFVPGETIAAAMLRSGVRDLTPDADPPAYGRVFCGIGACQACLVRQGLEAAFEACLTLASDGMRLTPVLPLAAAPASQGSDVNV